jgi:hypothetical protein
MLIFAAQISISCSSLLFAMMMLYLGNDPGIYLPIITGIIGCWLPSPSSQNRSSFISERREIKYNRYRRMNISNTPNNIHDIEQPLLEPTRT